MTSADPVTRIVGTLHARACGAGKWSAKCPAHDDRNASLSISAGDDRRALLHCHAGCPTADVLAKLGLKPADLFPPKGDVRGRIVATYDYRDPENSLLYQVVRFAPKDFRQRKPDGRGGYEWKLNGVRRVLYRLPELLSAAEDAPDDWVLIVEGEKDVDNLRGLGLVATCNVGGAGKWRAEYSETLRGRRVAVIADKDAPGRKHAEDVAASLLGVAASVKLLELPGDGKDASDWIAAGGTADQLRAIIEAAPPHRDAASEQPDDATAGPILVDLADVKRRTVDWLWPGKIPMGKAVVLAGDGGVGKSVVTVDLAARITTGSPWPDGSGDAPRGSVLMVTAEDEADDTLGPRYDAAGGDPSPGRLKTMTMVRRVNRETGKHEEVMFDLSRVGDLETALASMTDCRAVIIDPVGHFTGGRVDAHRDNELRAVLAPVGALCAKCHATLILVAHVRKAPSTNASDTIMGSKALVNFCRAAWHLSEDKQQPGRVLMLPSKFTLGPRPHGLAFTIVGGLEKPGRVVWERDPVQLKADDVLVDNATPGPDPEAREAAEEWLRDLLASGPVASGDMHNPEPGTIRAQAKEADFSWRTVRRAADKLGVRRERDRYTKAFTWRLPRSVV